MLFNSLMLLWFCKANKSRIIGKAMEGNSVSNTDVGGLLEIATRVLLSFFCLKQNNKHTIRREKESARQDRFKPRSKTDNKLVQLLQPNSAFEASSMMSEDKMTFRGFLVFRQLFHF